MIELIPTLFAQQQLKQATVPVQPIEQPATPTLFPTPVTTPTPAIASPESATIFVTATPAPNPLGSPAPSPQPLTPLTSTISLPQVPEKTLPVPQSAPSAVESQSVNPPSIDSKEATNSKPAIANPIPSTKPSTPRPVSSVRPTPSPLVQSKPTPAKTEAAGIEIPVPKPITQTAPQTPTQQQKQLLEQRLADIVARDRQVKQAQQRDNLVTRAYSLATQRRFAQARTLLQDPSIPADVRDQILSNINSLESASRTIGVTGIKEPVTKPARPATIARKPSRTVARVPQTAAKPQAITIKVPTAIQSLPIQRRSPIANPTAGIASDDSTGGYIDQLVTPPKNLQAFNRNLPQATVKGQILYPLPEPVPVTSGFGWRRHPVTGVRRFHAGIDLGAAQGTPVIASRAGKVTIADRMGGYGLAIVMQQPNGKQDTLYAHLSQIYVRPGQQIQPGTIIGRVGSTGLSTGPHLHYEARQMTNTGWVAVNPAAQLEAARVRLVQALQQDDRPTSSGQGG